MPVPVVDGFAAFLGTQLEVTIWDGEVPHYDPSGNPVVPSETDTANWPVVKVTMSEGGFARNWTFEDPYDDHGEVIINCWGTTRAQLETPVSGTPIGILNRIETLLAQASNWPLIQLGGDRTNPAYVIFCLLTRWYCGQMEGIRLQGSQLLYHGILWYDVDIHGAISTF